MVASLGIHVPARETLIILPLVSMTSLRLIKSLTLTICSTDPFEKLISSIFLSVLAPALILLGAGAIAGISTAKAITVAGLTAVAAVIEKLARAFMDDGKLTADEINSAFSTVDKGAKTVADVEVEERRASQKAKANKG